MFNRYLQRTSHPTDRAYTLSEEKEEFLELRNEYSVATSGVQPAQYWEEGLQLEMIKMKAEVSELETEKTMERIAQRLVIWKNE